MKDYHYQIKMENLSSRGGGALWAAKVRIWEHREDEAAEIHPNGLMEVWDKSEEGAKKQMQVKVDEWLKNNKEK